MANHDSVGLLYRAIEKDLHESLRFDDSSFLKIARTMTGGLSGAEVYLIHLHCPILEGDYFLKIEKKKKPQADPANIPFPHAKCAAFVHNEECNAYIFAPAGLSTTEFCSYREAKPNQKILQSIISKHLRTCQEKGKIMQPGMVAPDKIMRTCSVINCCQSATFTATLLEIFGTIRPFSQAFPFSTLSCPTLMLSPSPLGLGKNTR